MASKHVQLIQRLHERTNAGSINWEETANEGTYQVAFPNYAVRISREYNQSYDEYDYTTTILNDEGVVIEEITDSDIHGYDEKVGGHTLMQETYETARRIAMGVEQALDSIIAELDSDLPF